MANMYAGVDVDKEKLVLSLNGAISEWPNTQPGCNKLIAKLSKTADIHIVCESTGGLEQLLANTCHRAAMPVTVAFPSRIRNFARSCGQWAKTDGIDAQMIARWGTATTPAATRPPTPQERELSQLVGRRQQLMASIGRHEQQLEGYDVPLIRKEMEQTIQRLKRERVKIEKALAKVAKSDTYKGKVDALVSIKGVGQVTALAVLAHMPELGTVNRRETAKLAGLAPFNKESGKSVGKRRIYGGRQALRKAVYMGAVSITKSTGPLASTYQNLIAKGKPPMVALIATMRKMLTIMNAVMREHLKATQTA